MTNLKSEACDRNGEICENEIVAHTNTPEREAEALKRLGLAGYGPISEASRDRIVLSVAIAAICEALSQRDAAIARAEQAEATLRGKRRTLMQACDGLNYVVGLLPGMAGSTNQPDNAVYTIMATKGEITKAREILEGVKYEYTPNPTLQEPVGLGVLVSMAVGAMENDPFADDYHLQGTSQQRMRFEHYANVALRASHKPIGDKA